MIRKKAGSIVNITSVVGHTGNGGQSMYSAAKSAVTGLTQSMAADLVGFGIRAKLRCTRVYPNRHDRCFERRSQK